MDVQIQDVVRAICETFGVDYFFYAEGEGSWQTGTGSEKDPEVIRKLIKAYSEAMPELPE